MKIEPKPCRWPAPRAQAPEVHWIAFLKTPAMLWVWRAMSCWSRNSKIASTSATSHPPIFRCHGALIYHPSSWQKLQLIHLKESLQIMNSWTNWTLLTFIDYPSPIRSRLILPALLQLALTGQPHTPQLHVGAALAARPDGPRPEPQPGCSFDELRVLIVGPASAVASSVVRGCW